MLSNPRRAAVVVLATSVGIAAELWADQHEAGLIGFVVGVVLALFVPTKNARCSIR